jgi:hypothetical protein
MFKEHLQKLFAAYDPQIQTLITRVLVFEQENISYERVPRFKESLDQIIAQVAASNEQERTNKDGAAE